MKTVLLNLAVAAVLALSISSCGKKKGADSKAAEACAVKEKTNKAFEDSASCETCCKDAGYDGYSWMLGSGCKCL
jgi:hypothetical protein